jgi:nitroreductase
MSDLHPDQLIQRLRWRYAVKQFDPSRQIPAATWDALTDSLVLAPSSFGLQPWKFLVVDTPALRQELKAASWNQSQITDASKLVVLLGKRTMTEADVDRFLASTSTARNQPLEALGGYRKMLVHFIQAGWAAKDLAAWNTRQVYLALGQLLTSAAMLGVDACPMEGIDMAAYDRILGLGESPFQTLCACTLGYRAANDKYATAPKVRYAKSEIVETR